MEIISSIYNHFPKLTHIEVIGNYWQHYIFIFAAFRGRFCKTGRNVSDWMAKRPGAEIQGLIFDHQYRDDIIVGF